MAEKKERTGKRLEDLSLINDWLFQETLADEKNGNKVARLILSVLLEREIGDIVVRTQKVATSGDPKNHAIRMDVYIEEEDAEKVGMENRSKAYYDLEVENSPSLKTLPQKSRFYEAIIDTRLLRTSTSYDELKPLWIFFITEKDLFEKGRMCYTFENRCVELPELSLNDGAKRIFLNASGTIGRRENLAQLLNYIVDSRKENAVNETTKELHNIVDEIRQSPERGIRYMLAIMQEFEESQKRKDALEKSYNKGIEKGINKGIEKGINKGIEKEKINIAISLIDILDDEIIADKTKLPIEKVRELRKQEIKFH